MSPNQRVRDRSNRNPTNPKTEIQEAGSVTIVKNQPTILNKIKDPYLERSSQVTWNPKKLQYRNSQPIISPKIPLRVLANKLDTFLKNSRIISPKIKPYRKSYIPSLSFLKLLEIPLPKKRVSTTIRSYKLPSELS